MNKNDITFRICFHNSNLIW